VQRALARDVQDRYQTAEAFAEDLKKLLVGYRFDAHELQELLRGLFRADFQKEEEDMHACRSSVPANERKPLEAPPPATPSSATPPSASATLTPSESHAAPSPSQPGARDEGKRGLWAKIKSKFTK
jgi:hypothetical protein